MTVLKDLLVKCWIVLCTIAFTLLFPLILILLCPFFAWRWVLSILVPKLCPRIKGLLDPLGSAFGSKGVYKHNLAIVSSVHVCDSSVELAELQHSFAQNVMSLKHPSYTDGRLLFPQLRCKVTEWLGFLWWEEIPDFNVCDYVRYYEGRFASGEGKGIVLPGAAGSGDEDELVKEIVQEGLEAPFRDGTSPWEILIVYRKESGQMYLFNRLSHAMSDSSFFNVLNRWGDQDSVPLPPPPPKKSALLECFPLIGQSVLSAILFLLLGPYTIMDQFILAHDSNEWTQVDTKSWVGKPNLAITEPISLEDLKRVRDKHHVRMLSLLLACHTAGLRSCIEKTGMAMPKSIHCLMPISVPHPTRGPRIEIGNFFTSLSVKLPIREVHSLRRLKLINAIIVRKLRLTIKLNSMFIRLASRLPIFFFKKETVKNIGPCSVLMPLQGPTEPITICNKAKGTMQAVGVGMLPGLGPCFQTITYNKSMRLVLAADPAVIPNPSTLQNMMGEVLKELEYLDKVPLGEDAHAQP